jgi:D-inositol-3-phosphate glycosyltransferase
MSYSIAMLSVHTSPLDSPGQTKDAGGMNVYIHELAHALAQQQSTIDIFTRRTSATTPQVVQISTNIRIIHINAGPLAPIRKHDLYHYLPLFERHIEEFRRKEERNYNIIHSHYWLSGIAALSLARQWHIPHVTTFHTLARLKQLAHPDEPEPPLRLEMEDRLIEHTDCIIAPTTDERTQLLRHCGATTHQIKVIPCGVDLALFVPQNRQWARTQLGLPVQPPMLLFAGRLDPFKGPDLLLRAAARMKENAYIVIVGGKPGGDQDSKGLQELAKQLKINHRVRFSGAQPRHKMPLLYSAADITVVPSYHESFGLAAVESLACGTPVVATQAGGLMTVVQHGKTGFLIPRCPDLFAERLDTLLSDSNLYTKVSAAARPSVLRFSWASVARQVYSVYSELTDNKNLTDSCVLNHKAITMIR